MTTLSSRGVADSRTTFDRIDSVFEVHGDALTNLTMERLRPYLREGEDDPAVRQILELMRRALRGGHDELVDSDQTRINEILQRQMALELAEEAATALRDRVQFARKAIEQSFGKAALVALPFDSRKAKKHDSLIDQTKYIVKALDGFKKNAKKNLKITDSMLEVAPPPELLAANLQAKIDALVEARAMLFRGRREDKTAKADKRDTLKAFNRDATDIRGLLRYFLRFAGMDEVAEQLSEPQRRSGGANDPPTTEVEAASPEAGGPPNMEGDPPTTEHVA